MPLLRGDQRALTTQYSTRKGVGMLGSADVSVLRISRAEQPQSDAEGRQGETVPRPDVHTARRNASIYRTLVYDIQASSDGPDDIAHLGPEECQ